MKRPMSAKFSLASRKTRLETFYNNLTQDH